MPSSNLPRHYIFQASTSISLRLNDTNHRPLLLHWAWYITSHITFSQFSVLFTDEARMHSMYNENGDKVIPSRLYLKVGYTNLGYTIRPFGITYLHFGITYFGGSLCVLLHHRYWCLHSQSFNCLPLLSNLKSNIVTSYFVHAYHRYCYCSHKN